MGTLTSSLEPLTRGDWRQLILELDGDDTFAGGDVLRFTARLRSAAGEVVIDKTSETPAELILAGATATATIVPADTTSLPIDRTTTLAWDWELWPGGNPDLRQTLDAGLLQVTPDVTRVAV